MTYETPSHPCKLQNHILDIFHSYQNENACQADSQQRISFHKGSVKLKQFHYFEKFLIYVFPLHPV